MSRGPLRAAASDPTRDRLLDAAEVLFAEKGYAEASVREITARAGANLAAVNYHFGDKDTLYREVFLRRFRQLREERIAGIRATRKTRGRKGPKPILHAYVRMVLTALLTEGSAACNLSQLMLREFLTPRLPAGLFHDELMEPVERELEAALREVLPGLSEEEARLGIDSVSGQVIYVVHQAYVHGGACRNRTVSEPIEQLTDHIVRFSAAGLRAAARGSRS